MQEAYESLVTDKNRVAELGRQAILTDEEQIEYDGLVTQIATFG